MTAAVIVHQGRVLVARRHDHVHLGGLWEFPGGKVEPGESFAACLRREIREELGMDLARIRRWRDLRHAYPERTVHLYFYRCWVTDAQARAAHPHGSQEIRWADARELRVLPFPQADIEVLAALIRLLARGDTPRGTLARGDSSRGTTARRATSRGTPAGGATSRGA